MRISFNEPDNRNINKTVQQHRRPFTHLFTYWYSYVRWFKFKHKALGHLTGGDTVVYEKYHVVLCVPLHPSIQVRPTLSENPWIY